MKVLVVEPYQSLRNLIVANILEEFPKCEVLVAEDFDSAWLQINEEFPEVVASCIYTGEEQTGIELLDRVKTNYPFTRVVLFSRLIGEDSEDFRADDLMQRGAYAAIPKSFEIAEHLNSAMRGVFNF